MARYDDYVPPRRAAPAPSATAAIVLLVAAAALAVGPRTALTTIGLGASVPPAVTDDALWRAGAALLVLIVGYPLLHLAGRTLGGAFGAVSKRVGGLSFWQGLSLFLLVTLALAILAVAMGLDWVKAIGNQLFVTVGIGSAIAIIGFLGVTLFQSLTERMTKNEKQVDEIRKEMSGALEQVSKGLSQEVRSKIDSLRDEIEDIQKKNPWLASVPIDKINAHSTDLAVRFENFFELEAIGEHAAATKMMYGLVAREKDRSIELAATPAEIDTVAEFALFALGDSELALHLHKRSYDNKYNGYDKDVIFLSSYLRSPITSYDKTGAERIVRNLTHIIPRRSLWETLFPMLRRRDADAEAREQMTARLQQNWRVQLALSQYYWFESDVTRSEEFLRAGIESKLDTRGVEERTLFLAGLYLLRGDDERVIALGRESNLRIIPARARMLFLVALAARNVGDEQAILKAAADARALPALNGRVSYFRNAIMNIAKPLEMLDRGTA